MVRVEKNQSYLFPREVPPSEIHRTMTSLAYILPTASRYWYEMLDRRTPRDVFAGLKKRGPEETPLEHALEGIDFSLSLVNEHKRANGLRAGVLTHNIDPSLLSVFGLDLTYAMNHADFTDHAIPHVRRMHRVIDQIILRVPELRHNNSIDRWLPALELFPHNHDMDQVLTLFRNKMLLAKLKRENRLEEFAQLKLDSKIGHAMAAGVMTMAMAGRYQEEGGMTDLDAAKARRNAFAAAIMIAKHDEPDRIDEALSQYMTIKKKGRLVHISKYHGDDPKYRKKTTGLPNLVEDFDRNRVDIFTLSPHQFLQILAYKKREGGQFVTGDNPLGLHPDFVKEYAQELHALDEDYAGVLPNLTGDERESFILAAKVAVFADEVEMIYPPYSSIMRSLKTERSRHRRWWPEGATAENMLDEIKRGGGNYKGPLSSDAYRILWESWELIEKARRSKERNAIPPAQEEDERPYDLVSAPYVSQIMKEHIFLRLLATRNFGERIMRGDLDVVDDIYGIRKDALTLKAVARSNKLSGMEKRQLKGKSPEEVAEVLQRKGEDRLQDRYAFRIRVLNNEAEELRGIIQRKPGWQEADEVQQEAFDEACDRLIGLACDVFDISEKEARQIEDKLHQGRDFYKTYDPLGGIPDTIREPQHNDTWQSLLQGELRGDRFYELREEAVRQEEALYAQIRLQEEKKQEERSRKRQSGTTSQSSSSAG